jgi:P27 family predicted phage terminase small subunit
VAGSRGPLKIVPDSGSVKSGDEEISAASIVPKVAPAKPDVVAANEELSLLWDQIVPELDRTGLVAPSDAPMIEVALRSFLLVRTAHEQIIADGGRVTVADTNHGGVKKSPAETVFRSQADLFLRYAQQLGMTWMSRARTPMPGGEGGEANPFAAPPATSV